MMNVRVIGVAMLLLLWPGLGHSAVWLEDGGEVAMECKGEESGAISCHANKERLAKYVKCHEQMKDAMRVMNQFAPEHSLDRRSVEAVYKSPSDRLREEAAKLEQQDKAITFFRETLQRCVEK